MPTFRQRYSAASIALHWVMLVLIVAAYVCMDITDFFPRGSDIRNAIRSVHFSLGLTVFALVWLRLLARLTGTTPAIQPAPPVWQARLAALMHVLLYVFMIGMPLLGWATLSARGKPIAYFGLTTLPALLGENKALARQLKDIHETGATIGYFLIGLHAAAALFHHYIKRDNTLRRMLLLKN
ncbi:cytochrome b [Polaromonas sp. C04]|uniref:cytochrome b n=1 Tax=Polaromonas sp. C04 TaxID=1945857 RepID=UPI0009854835|nr:cytochrome b [Polaromonas sp. C04]OOG54321.1 cytochrome B [Polaromonas sp. C04]